MNGKGVVALRGVSLTLNTYRCCFGVDSLLQYSHMVQVTRKDEREANENIIRRFNRKVLQSGVLAEAKASMRFSKPLSKPERRVKAIIRKERKADKLNKARLGLR